MRILVVTNGSDSAKLIRDSIAEQGFEVEYAAEFLKTSSGALPDPIALIILDASNASQNGAGKFREIRKQTSIPVLVLIATNTADVRSAWLEAGADDCLAVPVHVRELIARVRAMLRRDQQSLDSHLIEANGVLMNLSTREVMLEGELVEVTSAEFDILAVLLRSAGRPVSRDHLMETIYHRKATVYDRSIDMHVSHLRKKLQTGRPVIKTIRGAGYQFCLPGPGDGPAGGEVVTEPSEV